MFKIYLIINLINNKKYVGQTIDSVEQRWKEHCQENSLKLNFPIKKAILKYGKENFIINQIDSAETLDEANEKEVYWGLFHNVLVPNGYSLKLGGRKHVHISKEIKQKISIANTGRKASEETKAKLKIARNKRVIPPESYIKAQKTLKKNHPNHYKDISKKAWNTIRASGKTQTTDDKSHWQTPEYKAKQSKLQRELRKDIGRAFICNETKQIFRSCGECARQMNLKSYKCIWKCLNNKTKSYSGFTFNYIETREEFEKRKVN